MMLVHHKCFSCLLFKNLDLFIIQEGHDCFKAMICVLSPGGCSCFQSRNMCGLYPHMWSLIWQLFSTTLLLINVIFDSSRHIALRWTLWSSDASSLCRCLNRMVHSRIIRNVQHVFTFWFSWSISLFYSCIIWQHAYFYNFSRALQ